MEFVIDAKSVYESIVAEQENIPAEDSLILVLLQLREGPQVGRLSRAWWCHTGDMLADALTKGGISRNVLIEALEQGTRKLKDIAECSWSRKAIQQPPSAAGGVLHRTGRVACLSTALLAQQLRGEAIPPTKATR